MKLFRSLYIQLFLSISLLLLPYMVSAKLVLPFSHHIETGNKTVFCMMKDADGILWVGTSLGLMTSAQLVADNGYVRHPLLNNIIQDIQQDNLHRLWLKTQSNGYLIYSPRTNDLIPDVRTYLQKKGLHIQGDMRVELDVEGKAWAYAGRQIWIYDSKTDFRKTLKLPQETGDIVCIKADKRGALIVTQGAIYLTPVQASKIHPRYYAKTPCWQIVNQKLVNRSPNGRIWLYTDMQLWSLSKRNANWVQHRELLPDATCMLRPKDGEYLLVGTSNNGVYIYNDDGKMVRRCFRELPLMEGFASNHIEALYYNPENEALAIAYHKHNLTIIHLNPQQFRNHYLQAKENMFLPEDVISFGGEDNNSVWMGTEDNGIYRVKIDGSDEVLENRYPKQAATMIHRDGDGKLWTGLYHQGLSCSDGRNYFSGYSPYCLIEVSPSRFFVVIMGEGLWVLNPKTGEKKLIPMESKWLMGLVRVGQKVYTATPKFLYIVDVSTLKTEKVPAIRFRKSDFKDGNKVMLADRRGWIWLVNYKGHSPVDIYDTKTGRIFQCEQLTPYEVYSLEEDEHGHIWCATDKGLVLVKLNKSHKTDISNRFELHCFGKMSHVLYNFRAMRRVGNQLVIGHTDGFHLVNPNILEKSIAHARPSERLILAALRVNEQYVSPGKNMDGELIINSDLPYLSHLDLAYDQNNLMLECHPKTFIDNERSSYSYCLKGLDDDWTSMDNHRITLSNLPPGNYQLLVKESDVNKHDFAEYELLSITIRPPFWQTIWAYIIYILLVGGMTAFIVRYYQNRKKYRSQINELMLKAEMQAVITPSKVEPVTMDEKLIADAVKIVEENMGDANFSVEELSEKLNMHRTNLYKKLQFLTGKTPTQFIRLMRLKRGKQLLSKGNVLISQVAYEVGFNDPKKFARYFKEEFGMLPSEYVKQQEGA